MPLGLPAGSAFTLGAVRASRRLAQALRHVRAREGEREGNLAHAPLSCRLLRGGHFVLPSARPLPSAQPQLWRREIPASTLPVTLPGGATLARPAAIGLALRRAGSAPPALLGLS